MKFRAFIRFIWGLISKIHILVCGIVLFIVSACDDEQSNLSDSTTDAGEIAGVPSGGEHNQPMSGVEDDSGRKSEKKNGKVRNGSPVFLTKEGEKGNERWMAMGIHIPLHIRITPF